jgi:hypothetical protein
MQQVILIALMSCLAIYQIKQRVLLLLFAVQKPKVLFSCMVRGKPKDINQAIKIPPAADSNVLIVSVILAR